MTFLLLLARAYCIESGSAREALMKTFAYTVSSRALNCRIRKLGITNPHWRQNRGQARTIAPP